MQTEIRSLQEIFCCLYFNNMTMLLFGNTILFFTCLYFMKLLIAVKDFLVEEQLIGSFCPQIPHAKQDQHGWYRCEISSCTERLWTNEVDVVIGTVSTLPLLLHH